MEFLNKGTGMLKLVSVVIEDVEEKSSKCGCEQSLRVSQSNQSCTLVYWLPQSLHQIPFPRLVSWYTSYLLGALEYRKDKLFMKTFQSILWQFIDNEIFEQGNWQAKAGFCCDWGCRGKIIQVWLQTEPAGSFLKQPILYSGLLITSISTPSPISKIGLLVHQLLVRGIRM